MQETYRMLAIIPKTDETIIGVYDEESCVYKTKLVLDEKDRTVWEEVSLRKQDILQHVNDAGINLSKLDAVTAIGGLLRPVEGGTYIVNKSMVDDLMNSYNGRHASNLGGIIAQEIAQNLHIPAFIIDPPVVDEMHDIARFSGFPTIERKSVFHALNQKAVARQAVLSIGKSYSSSHLIIAHIGHGISVAAHQDGKVVDVNNGLHGDGPFSLERAGTIPSTALINLCYQQNHTKDQLIRDLTFHSGLKSYLHVHDISEVITLLKDDDSVAHQMIQTMGYQIAKEIGAMATVLSGKVDAIILTGEFAKIQTLTDCIMARVNWISDVLLYPGEADLQALNAGTLRVLRKEEQPKVYME